MRRRVRIAHVITRLILGGAQENTLLTAIGQHSDPGFEVDLITGTETGPEGDLFGKAREAGVNLLFVPSLVREIRPVADVRAYYALRALLARGHYDIVHTHSSKAGILGRMAARSMGVPIVVHTLHSLVFHQYMSRSKRAFYIRVERHCASLPDVLICVNETTAKGALEAGIGKQEQYRVIYSGMDLDPFLEIGKSLSPPVAKSRLGIPASAPVVGKIARLSPLKGHDYFLRAARKIADAVPGAWFLLVGDGPLREQLRAQAHDLGIAQRTVFTGLVPPEEVPACIQAMDVAVHTSLREGIARVLPQAGATGKPVVVFDLDGAPEVIRHGVSGYLVPPCDAEGVARWTVDLLHNPELRQAFGEKGRAFAAANFRTEQMVQKINEIYFSLLGRDATGRSGVNEAVPAAIETR